MIKDLFQKDIIILINKIMHRYIRLSIVIVILLLVFFSYFSYCNRVENIKLAQSFIEKNRDFDFSIFNGWSFHPRSRGETDSYMLYYYNNLSTSQDSIDTISLIVSFSLDYFNSISVRTNDETSKDDDESHVRFVNDIIKFCKIKNIARSDYNKYMFRLVQKFVHLKIEGIFGDGRDGLVFIYLNDNTSLVKLLHSPLPQKNKVGKLMSEYTQFDDTWYVKIDSVSHKNSD